MSAGTLVFAGLALGAAIAIASRTGGRDDDEQRRTEELARLTPSTDDQVTAGARAGDDDGTRAGDVSLIARTINENVSEVDAP